MSAAGYPPQAFGQVTMTASLQRPRPAPQAQTYIGQPMPPQPVPCFAPSPAVQLVQGPQGPIYQPTAAQPQAISTPTVRCQVGAVPQLAPSTMAANIQTPVAMTASLQRPRPTPVAAPHAQTYIGQPLPPQPVPCVAPAPAVQVVQGPQGPIYQPTAAPPPAVSTPTMSYRQPMMAPSRGVQMQRMFEPAQRLMEPSQPAPLGTSYRSQASRLQSQVTAQSFEPPMVEARPLVRPITPRSEPLHSAVVHDQERPQILRAHPRAETRERSVVKAVPEVEEETLAEVLQADDPPEQSVEEPSQLESSQLSQLEQESEPRAESKPDTLQESEATLEAAEPDAASSSTRGKTPQRKAGGSGRQPRLGSTDPKGNRAGSKTTTPSAKSRGGRDRQGSKEPQDDKKKSEKGSKGSAALPEAEEGQEEGLPSPKSAGSPTSPKDPFERNEHGDRGEGSTEAMAALQAATGVDDRTLVVFDFDRTIMKEHMWKKYKDTDISKIKIADDHFVDLHRFRALVFTLRMHGHNVAVATFGRRDVVDKALHYALGNPHEVSVRTPADFGHKDGSGILGNKNTHLADLAERYQVAAKSIILVDDDRHNIEAAEKAGVQGQWVPSGLEGSVVEQIAVQVGVQPMDPRRAAEFAAEATERGKLTRHMGRRDTGPAQEVLSALKKFVDDGGELPEFEGVELSSSSDETTPGGHNKPNARLQSAFAAYTLGQDEMDCKSFSKLCSECNLVDAKFTCKDADVTFAKIATKAGQCLTFQEFEAALELVAKVKETTTEDVVNLVCDQGRVRKLSTSNIPKLDVSGRGAGSRKAGEVVVSANVVRTVAKMPAPNKSGSQTTPRKDKNKEESGGASSTATPSSGTGTRRVRKGASITTSSGGGADEERPASPSGSKSKKVPEDSASTPGTTPGDRARRSSKGSTAPTPQAPAPGQPVGGASGLQEVFNRYSSAGGFMDQRGFVKMCKDCGLLDKKLSVTDADLIVAKVLPKGSRRLGFDEFDRALGLVAQKRGMDGKAIHKAVCGLTSEKAMAPAA